MNDRWRCNAIGITAYKNGFQTIISYSDIGKKLTANEYILIENSYIEAVKIIMQLNKCKELNIRYLEKCGYKKGLTAEEDEKLHEEYIKINDKQKITYKDIDVVMKLILREIIWCDLINLSKRLYIRFGYDYYMYFNTRIKKDLYQDKIEMLDLFVS